MSLSEVPFLEALQDASAGNRKAPKSTYLASGVLAVVDQGKGLVAGYTNDPTLRATGDGPAIVFGDHTRAFKYVDFPFAMGADGVKVLRARGGFDTKYLFRYLESIAIPSAGYSRHFKFLKEIKVPKPPLEEQRRIASILDHADDLGAKRRQALAHLDSLTQAIFHDMFGDPEDAERQIAFGDVTALVGGRNLVHDDAAAESLFRVLKISAVTSGQFLLTESKPLPGDYTPPPLHMVQPGDLLMSRANTTALVGAVAYVNETPPNLALPDKVWKFAWHDNRSVPLFYHALFSSPTMRRRISQLASGTGGSMKNISKAKLDKLSLPMVDYARQEAFATHAMAVTAAQGQAMRALNAQIELDASLKARAFQGVL